MKPFTPEELAAWIDEQYNEVNRELSPEYELKDGEFTADMYLEQTGLSRSVAYRRLKTLVEAGRLESRWESMNGHGVKVYTPVMLDKVG